MKYLKAVYGAAVAGLGSFAVAYADNVITGPEWVTVATVTLSAFGVIWAVPNAKSEDQAVAEKRAEAQALVALRQAISAAPEPPAPAPTPPPPA
jgi:hypothetical protein